MNGHMSFPSSFLTACLLILCWQVASADVDRRYEIDEEIVVTATRSPYSIGQVANTVRTIDREIIARSGVQNIAELLRNFSSVQVRDSVGNGRDTRLALRGYSAISNALVLVDGRKLNNSDLGGQDLTSVSIADIERIEILEGGAGALFGDQAVGGVVNIITAGHTGQGGRASLSRGSYDHDRYTVSYSNQFADGWFYRFSTDLDRSAGYRDDSDFNYESYSGKLTYRYDNGNVFLEGRQNDNEYLLTGALSVGEAAANRRQAGGSFNNYAADNRVLRLGFDHRFSDMLQLLATATDRDEDVVIHASSGFGDSTTQQSRRVKTFDPRLVLSLAPWRLTVGIDREDVEYDFAIDFGFGLSGSKHNNKKHSEYAQLLYSASRQLILQAGIRHANLRTEVEPYDINYHQSAVIQQLGVVWRGENWRYYLNRDETFRFPLADENVDFFGVVNLLDVQRGVSWEFGGERFWRYSKVKVAFFQQENSDEIGFDPAIGVFGANTNFDDTRRRGITLEAGWQVNDRWSFDGIYTYIDARFIEGRYQDNRIPDVARELVKAQINYRPFDSWSLSIEGVYTGSQSLDLANNAVPSGGYTVTNLAANWRTGDWTLHARLNNMMAKEYTELATFFGAKALYPSPERHFLLTLSYSF